MTMHLLGPACTTISTKKRSKKVTVATHTKMALDWREYNIRMKRLGSKTKTFDEYIQYRKGNYKPKLRGMPMPDYKVSDHREQYPSSEGVGVTFAKTPNTYTGTLIKGISTLHKSNAVPVISEEEMHDHAKMRR